MGKQKVYVMEADKVVAEAPVESMAISPKDLKEIKEGLIPYPAGEWDATTPYFIEEGKVAPMVQWCGRYYVLRETADVVVGIVPDGVDGPVYWNELDTPKMVFTSEPYVFSMKNLNRGLRKSVARQEKRYGLVVRQMEALRVNERDFRVIHRCLWYGDIVPRKYRSKYGVAIREMKRMNLREAFVNPKLVGTKL